MLLAVDGQIQVDHLLLDFIVGEGGSAHLGEDGRGVDAEGHIPDDLFDDLSAFFLVGLVDDVVQLAGLAIQTTF